MGCLEKGKYPIFRHFQIFTDILFVSKITILGEMYTNLSQRIHSTNKNTRIVHLDKVTITFIIYIVSHNFMVYH